MVATSWPWAGRVLCEPKVGIDPVNGLNLPDAAVQQYVDKLSKMGVGIHTDEILTSAQATADYLAGVAPLGTRVFVVGQDGLWTALRDAGFTLVDDDAEYVVAGMDFTICYERLAQATLLIRAGAQFIGTNPDLTFPSEYGPLPGAGSILAYIQAATGVGPTIIGKPNKIIFEEALHRLGGTPADTVMVGDRLNTDIAGGQTAGLRTILLLSGISSRADAAQSEWQPTWILDDLTALTRALENGQLSNSQWSIGH